MSRSNPTSLRIGMSGELDGRRQTLTGRALMSMEVAGETWYWNEYFLRAEDGSEATLVYEQTDTGGDWKYFRYFEPENPLSVAEASRQRVGSQVAVDGLQAVVDLVDQAKVEAIEGAAPEGLRTGQLSNYFNAQAGGRMLVVSWSEGVVEHYIGDPLSRTDVEIAFGVRLAEASRAAPQNTFRERDLASQDFPIRKLIPYVIIGCLLVVGYFQAAPASCSRSPASATRRLPSENLAAGTRLQLAQGIFLTRNGGLLEFSTAKEGRHCRLYLLEGTDGRRARLLLGAAHERNEAWLLWEQTPDDALTPVLLGALRANAPIRLGDSAGTVKELFRSRLVQAGTLSSEQAAEEKLNYGLLASAPGKLRLIDWNENSLRVFQIEILSEKALKAALLAP